jgi:exodeoxyribonuclease VII large subunit
MGGTPRLPFDPERMAARQSAAPGSPPPASAAGAAPVTVSQLAAMIDVALRERLPASVRVVGEVGRFTERTHWYFDLKDSGAVIPCVMWQSAARKAGFVPALGQQVVLAGRVEHYPQGGRTQFIAEKIEPVGAGALDVAYRRLVEELRQLGWFAPERKRALPMFPRKVAIVTSRGGAALQDVLDTVGRRCPALSLALADVRVQGDGAAEQIARTIRAIGRVHAECGIDILLVTRGGGSLEDLWSFNERIVAAAIYDSPIPVVAAIGHETDTTIAELVADLRCATPTQAAMRIAPDADALRTQLDSMGGRLGSLVERHIRLDSERLRGASRHAFFASRDGFVRVREVRLKADADRLRHAMLDRLRASMDRHDRAARGLSRHRPEAAYARREADLHHLAARLRASLGAMIDRRGAALESAARGLDLVGPHNVLKRGYSVTFRADGRALRSAADARQGETLSTRLADGSVESIVTPKGADLAALRPMPSARRARRQTDDRNQMGLF